MGNSYAVLYNYHGATPKAYVKYLPSDGAPFSGYEYLGHVQVEKRIYKKNYDTSDPTDLNNLEERIDNYFYSFLLNGTNINEYTCFKPDPRKGISYKVIVYDSLGAEITKAESSHFHRPDHDCASISDDEGYFVALEETTSTIDGKTTRVTYGPYNQYGNLERTDFHGDVSITGDEKAVKTEYLYNTGSWILGLPKSTEVYEIADGTEILKAQTLHYYDGQEDWEVWEDSSSVKGELTKTGKGKEGDLFIYSHFEYDDVGNLVRTWDAKTSTAQTPTTETKIPIHTFRIVLLSLISMKNKA